MIQLKKTFFSLKIIYVTIYLTDKEVIFDFLINNFLSPCYDFWLIHKDLPNQI